MLNTGVVPKSLEFLSFVAKSWLLRQISCMLRFPIFALSEMP
jgi:hypothetical protein